MVYDVLVKKINLDIEEEIVVQINNIELNCFVVHWTSNVEINKIYKARIGVNILDDVTIKKQDSRCGFEQIDNSFAYIISGKFHFDRYSIDCGIVMEIDDGEVDLSDYAYLDSHNIALEVDRITLEFI